jgi:hypothetical protein
MGCVAIVWNDNVNEPILLNIVILNHLESRLLKGIESRVVFGECNENTYIYFT